MQLLLGSLMLLRAWPLLSSTLTDVGFQGSALSLSSVAVKEHCYCHLAGSTHWALLQQGNSDTF